MAVTSVLFAFFSKDIKKRKRAGLMDVLLGTAYGPDHSMDPLALTYFNMAPIKERTARCGSAI